MNMRSCLNHESALQVRMLIATLCYVPAGMVKVETERYTPFISHDNDISSEESYKRTGHFTVRLCYARLNAMSVIFVQRISSKPT